MNGVDPCGSLPEHFFKNKNIDNDELRLKIIRLIRASNPSISQRQIAKGVGYQSRWG